jgi:anti-repressor protein
MLQEGQDFVVLAEKGLNPNGGRPTAEYYLTLDAAKQICMMSQTIKGLAVRKYFIEVEKRYRQEPTVFHFPVVLNRGSYNQQVRVVTRDGEPWFVASDVCDILEIANSRQAAGRLFADEKSVDHTLGSNRGNLVVNESGLYALIVRSDKPVAQQFRRWVTSVVLPQIRKTGGYIPVTKDMTDTEILSLGWKIMEKTIAELKPKAIVYDNCLDKEGNVPLTLAARKYKMSATALSARLCDAGVFEYSRAGGQWRRLPDGSRKECFVVAPGYTARFTSEGMERLDNFMKRGGF